MTTERWSVSVSTPLEDIERAHKIVSNNFSSISNLLEESRKEYKHSQVFKKLGRAVIPNFNQDFEKDCLKRITQHASDSLKITVRTSEMNKTIKMLLYFNGHWKLSERSSYYLVNGKFWSVLLKFTPRFKFHGESSRFDFSSAIYAFKQLSKNELWSMPNFGNSESKPNKSFKDLFTPKTKKKYVKKPLTKKQLKARKRGK